MTCACQGIRKAAAVIKEKRPSIKINLQALSRKVQDDPVFFEIASIAHEQTKKLQEMVSDLQVYSKRLELSVVETTFKKTAEPVIAELEAVARDKGISLKIEDNLQESKIRVDADLIGEVFKSLLVNAVQWATAGSVVSITAIKDPGREGLLAISVNNSGPIIEVEQLDKLFSPLYSTLTETSGLGLANAQKIVTYHGGSIRVENKLEESGAIFTMYLPFKGPVS